MKKAKLSLENIKGKLSRLEMKQIMAGSEEVRTCDSCEGTMPVCCYSTNECCYDTQGRCCNKKK
jgi:hypothetical protein